MKQSLAGRALRGFVVTCMLCAGAAPALAAQAASVPDETVGPLARPLTNLNRFPLTYGDYPWVSPISVQTDWNIAQGTSLYTRTLELRPSLVRINRIEWRFLQADQNGPIDWGQLSYLEETMRAMRATGAKLVLTVDNYPRWASIVGSWTKAGTTFTQTSCSQLRPEMYSAYGQFVAQVAQRYKDAPYNVHDWELGNEVDVDPGLVYKDSGFGCWGDVHDASRYYGGQAYGNMLKVVAPYIRAADPFARIWVGGLLLDHPYTGPDLAKEAQNPPLYDYPGNFLRGVLAAGAASSFDVLPFHSYASYGNIPTVDYDYHYVSPAWKARGGAAVGKTGYLKSILAEYGVSKDMYLNEGGMMCPYDSYDPSKPYCQIPGPEYYRAQSMFAVHAAVRALSAGLKGYTWYTLEGPGWRNGGMLTNTVDARPVYTSFRELGNQLSGLKFSTEITNTPGISMYVFAHPGQELRIAWVPNGVTQTLTLASASYLRSYDLYGAPITPSVSGSQRVFTVTASPIYVWRSP